MYEPTRYGKHWSVFDVGGGEDKWIHIAIFEVQQWQSMKQAGAELGQAQVKQEVVDEVLAESQLKLQLQLQWLLEFTTFSVGWVGVLDEIKAILNSS